MVERGQLGGGSGRLEVGDGEFWTRGCDRDDVDADLAPRLDHRAMRLALRAVARGCGGGGGAGAVAEVGGRFEKRRQGVVPDAAGHGPRLSAEGGGGEVEGAVGDA